MKKAKISLVLPCYNEAQHFTKSIDKILKTLQQTRFNFEVIFVEDKSIDKTELLIDQILKKKSNINIRVIKHTKNLGRGASVADGIRAADGQIVGYIDIDCEVHPHYTPLFIESVLSGNDLVVGRRIYKTEPFALHRWITSIGYAFMIKKLFKLPISDTEAGYKFFRKKNILPILETVKDKHWFWDTEIVIKAFKAGLKIKEIPVVFIRRRDKTSTVNIIPDTIKYLIALFRLKWETK